MTASPIGVAVIGAGMAGRAHAGGYPTAPTVFGAGLPDVRLVAIADSYQPFAAETARRYGYQRAETRWEAIAEAPDVDAVSVVVANTLHRDIALLMIGGEFDLSAGVAVTQLGPVRVHVQLRVHHERLAGRSSSAWSTRAASTPAGTPTGSRSSSARCCSASSC